MKPKEKRGEFQARRLFEMLEAGEISPPFWGILRLEFPNRKSFPFFIEKMEDAEKLLLKRHDEDFSIFVKKDGKGKNIFLVPPSFFDGDGE
jgi:hypothetical protein